MNLLKTVNKAALLGFLAVSLPLALTACNGGGGGAGGVYQQAWYDVYGYHCGNGTPRPGCNFYSDGYKIVDYEDPYYSSTYYNLSYDYWYYTDSYGYSQTYTGWAWLSPSGVLYDDYGYALNEDGEGEGRDLIGNVAALEEQAIQSSGKKFADRYALAEDVGVRIARTLNDWATLGKKRARTDQDIADFSKRLYGIDVSKAQAALEDAKAGDTEKLEDVNVQVATHWGTQPETSKEILKNWYKKQLSDFNIKK